LLKQQLKLFAEIALSDGHVLQELTFCPGCCTMKLSIDPAAVLGVEQFSSRLCLQRSAILK
jgi:hypothetical protein